MNHLKELTLPHSLPLWIQQYLLHDPGRMSAWVTIHGSHYLSNVLLNNINIVSFSHDDTQETNPVSIQAKILR